MYHIRNCKCNLLYALISMLNRPQALNAFNERLYKDLEEAFSEFDIDEDLWVCIVHGAGRCFSAGGDIKGRFFNQSGQEKVLMNTNRPYESFLLGTINWKPVIAAVHNYCLGVGFDLALQSDLIVASEDARFGITEIKRGMSGGPASAMLRWFIPSKVASIRCSALSDTLQSPCCPKG